MLRKALAFGSGMGAISAVFTLLCSGDHVVTSQDVYSGTYSYLTNVADRMNIKTTFLHDPTDPINFEKAILDYTKVM